MKKLIQNAILAASGFALLAAPAQAACWKSDEVQAAQVRDLDTMLMVGALRCRNGGDNFLSHYNHFVKASRPALIEVNDRLHAHFAASVGAARALTAYDSFVTRTANRYGAGVAGLDCGDMADIVTAAIADGESFSALAALADRADVEPVLDGPLCGVRTAYRR